jgi:hypothetical protein
MDNYSLYIIERICMDNKKGGCFASSFVHFPHTLHPRLGITLTDFGIGFILVVDFIVLGPNIFILSSLLTHNLFLLKIL